MNKTLKEEKKNRMKNKIEIQRYENVLTNKFDH